VRDARGGRRWKLESHEGVREPRLLLAFIDRSRSHAGTWCEMATCGSVFKIAIANVSERSERPTPARVKQAVTGGVDMAIGNAQRSVLVLGRSQRVLDDVVGHLHDLGHRAEATNDFTDVIERFDVREVDLVVFGGQVPSDRKAELRHEMSTINPHIIFVQGLAGIPGLIVNQIQGAFAANLHQPAEAPTFTSDDGTIRFTLAEPAQVKVTAWWATAFVPPDPTSDSLTLLDDRLVAGEHALTIPDHIPTSAAFATAQIANVIHAFSIATER
jgi:CGNR zinc finger